MKRKSIRMRKTRKWNNNSTRGTVLLVSLVFASVFGLTLGCQSNRSALVDGESISRSIISGFFVNPYGKGKLLTEDQIQCLFRAAQQRTFIKKSPALSDYKKMYYVYLRTRSDMPTICENQYAFWNNFRYMQVRSQYVTTNVIPELTFELSENASERIASICSLWTTEDQESSFFWNGKNFEDVPTWRTIVEPWAETMDTIKIPDTLTEQVP